jgi:hypothetical protein
MNWMEERMWKKLRMLAVNIRVSAVNVRHEMGIVKTVRLRQMTGTVEKAKLVKMNRD